MPHWRAEVVFRDAGVPLVEAERVLACRDLQPAFMDIRHERILLGAEAAIAGVGLGNLAFDRRTSRPRNDRAVIERHWRVSFQSASSSLLSLSVRRASKGTRRKGGQDGTGSGSRNCGRSWPDWAEAGLPRWARAFFFRGLITRVLAQIVVTTILSFVGFVALFNVLGFQIVPPKQIAGVQHSRLGSNFSVQSAP